jgi:hypothetical protein
MGNGFAKNEGKEKGGCRRERERGNLDDSIPQPYVPQEARGRTLQYMTCWLQSYVHSQMYHLKNLMQQDFRWIMLEGLFVPANFIYPHTCGVISVCLIRSGQAERSKRGNNTKWTRKVAFQDEKSLLTKKQVFDRPPKAHLLFILRLVFFMYFCCKADIHLELFNSSSHDLRVAYDIDGVQNSKKKIRIFTKKSVIYTRIENVESNSCVNDVFLCKNSTSFKFETLWIEPLKSTRWILNGFFFDFSNFKKLFNVEFLRRWSFSLQKFNFFKFQSFSWLAEPWNQSDSKGNWINFNLPF